MYFVGAGVAVPVAWLLRLTFFRGEPAPFVMELPPMQWPSWRVVFQRVWERGEAFLYRAGTLIFCTAVLVWAAGYFPASHAELDRQTAQLERWQGELERAESEGDGQLLSAAAEQLETLEGELAGLRGELLQRSFLGMAGRGIEPLVAPLGWDWRIGVGVLASFPAREVIIATLGTIYSLGGDVDESDSGLVAALQQSRWPDGRLVFTLPVALSVMVFFALCAQCAATLMVIRRETNSWRWPVFTFVYMTTLAYLGAWLTYQVGSWLL
jgi:ferrous iron transport protein B